MQAGNRIELLITVLQNMVHPKIHKVTHLSLLMSVFTEQIQQKVFEAGTDRTKCRYDNITLLY